MRDFPQIALVMTLSATAFLNRPVHADDPPVENTQRDGAFDIIESYVSRHRLAADAAPDVFHELRTQPLLVWTNPTRARFSGGVYLWTRNDRPLAFCGIHVGNEDGQMTVGREFHTLTAEALQVQFDGDRIWTPAADGIEFHPVTDAGQPADSPAMRLRQMKAIASEFTVSISKRDTPRESLRVLPRPVFRYADDDEGVVDGAIIAFVQGTDPEAMLLIEARARDGESHWHYAIARCTAWGVTARAGGDTVYDVPPYYGSGDRPISAPFFCIHKSPVE